MKNKVPLLTLALIALNTAVHAGPPLERVTRGNRPPLRTTAQAIVQPFAVAPMSCAACTTESLREPRHRAPLSNGMSGLVVVGSKHRCAKCEGTVTHFKGKVDDQMKKQDATCQDTACCAASVAARL